MSDLKTRDDARRRLVNASDSVASVRGWLRTLPVTEDGENVIEYLRQAECILRRASGMAPLVVALNSTPAPGKEDT